MQCFMLRSTHALPQKYGIFQKGILILYEAKIVTGILPVSGIFTTGNAHSQSGVPSKPIQRDYE
jgi:hypothetical protein